MKSWLIQHRQAFFAALRRLLRQPISTLATVLVIGVTLSLPVGLYVLMLNGQELSSELRGDPQISLFLDLESGKAEVEAVRLALSKRADLQRFEFVPKARALDELKRTADIGDVVDTLGRNPLPDAYLVFPKAIEPAALEHMRDELAKLPKIAHAQVDTAWAKKLDIILRVARNALGMVAILLAFGLVAVTANTIRLQILSRRDEIEVSLLIGATDQFIRRPFLYFAVMQGVLGALTAWATLYFSLRYLNSGIAELATLYGSHYRLQMLAVGDSLSLLLFAAWLCWLGAYLSVNRHLRSIAP